MGLKQEALKIVTLFPSQNLPNNEFVIGMVVAGEVASLREAVARQLQLVRKLGFAPDGAASEPRLADLWHKRLGVKDTLTGLIGLRRQLRFEVVVLGLVEHRHGVIVGKVFLLNERLPLLAHHLHHLLGGRHPLLLLLLVSLSLLHLILSVNGVKVLLGFRLLLVVIRSPLLSSRSA